VQVIVEPGYEAVRDAFAKGAATLGRGGGAYCAFVGGRPVVDLWAGTARPGVPWQSDTRTVIMSASKGLAALCVQILEDRGQIDIDAPVSEYWPEYAQAGKGSTLVRHVLLHTAGVLGFDKQADLVGFDGIGWDDYEAISAGFAAATPEWEPGTKHGYHALSYGWLVGEIVRRVSGRSLGQFLAEEVARPLGLELSIGTSEADLQRVAWVHPTRTAHLPGFVRKPYEASVLVARDPSRMSGRAFLGNGETNAVEQVEQLFNNPRVLAAEFPSGGATATARALARLWALLAAGGELDGVRLLSEESVRRWSRVESNEPDALSGDVTLPRFLAKAAAAGVPRTFGSMGNGAMPGLGHRFGPNPVAYGVEGLGGQYAFCDPDSRIAVGYVRNDLAVMDVLQPTLTRVLYDCARDLGHPVFTPPATPRLRGLLESAAGSYLRRKVAVRP
jgi:CubicO group peptidase (beta-lactamase class C family)